MIDYDTKEAIWQTTESSGNSHSIELLPNGIIVTGGTNAKTAAQPGCTLTFFNLNGADPSKCIYEMDFDDAHGVLWDPKYEVVWALGRDKLTALEVTANEDGSVTVVKNEELSVVMPMDHGHDLQPVYGNSDYLLVTGTTIKMYNKVTKEFTEVYHEGKSVKGVGILPNGDFLYIYPDGLAETWNSTWINHVDPATGEITYIHSNQGRFYKLRVLNFNYQ
jgi:hypothetical protein